MSLVVSVGCRTGVRHQVDPNAKGPYSGAVEAGGFVFVAGKIGDPAVSFALQMNQALDAVQEELGRAGLALSDVVSATVFLTDIELYGSLNRIYSSRFSRPFPARTVVAVRSLPAGAKLEIQVIARR